MQLFGTKKFTLDREQTGIFAADVKNVDPKYKDQALELADAALKYELAPLTASLYMSYARTGERAPYENPYHERRRRLANLIVGSLYAGTEKYIDKIVDIAWAICEETTWVIPPHNVTRGYVYGGRSLADTTDEFFEVDLFAAATAAVLSATCLFFKKEIDEATDGVLSERIGYEIERRIIKPFQTREMRWESNFINNWVPWIISNILLCVGVFVGDVRKKMSLVSRSMFYLDRFVGTYGDDCGCNEGASYWNAAIASLFDACETLADLSGGELDFTHSEFMRRACRFIVDMNIDPETMLFVNFADCGPRLSNISGKMLCRMGAATGDGTLLAFGKKVLENFDTLDKGNGLHFFIYRNIKNLFRAEYEGGGDLTPANAAYNDLNIAVVRAGDYVAVLKGGHNAESHNHNDVGSFVFYADKKPVLIDPGSLEYRRDTFNANRYKIWTNQSSYHNLPDVGGVMEKEGREYAADGFALEGSTARVSYGKAYPVKAVCLRTITLDESGLTVSDTAEAEGEVTYHFITHIKPEINGNVATLGNIAVKFSSNGGVSVDTVDISSSPMQTRIWNGTELYRINVKAKTLITKISKIN
ncbi:MAG: heparinase II/III family protein [Clostridia bacterium]|nr:heparinase II/III family protein [Clostridia bacterium]